MWKSTGMKLGINKTSHSYFAGSKSSNEEINNDKKKKKKPFWERTPNPESQGPSHMNGVIHSNWEGPGLQAVQFI